MQLALPFTITLVLFYFVFVLSFLQEKLPTHFVNMTTSSDNPNSNIDNRSSTDGHKQSPPAFLDLADSVSFL